MSAAEANRLTLGDVDISYAVRPGHYKLLVPRFHTSRAILCRHMFGDSFALDGASRAIIEHIPREALERTNVLVVATRCGFAIADRMAAYLAQQFGRREEGRIVRTRCESPGELVGEGVSGPNPGDHCLIVIEHILTGRILRQLAKWITDRGALCEGVAAICNRCPDVKTKLRGIPLFYPLEFSGEGVVNVDTDDGSCPMCDADEPLIVAEPAI